MVSSLINLDAESPTSQTFTDLRKECVKCQEGLAKAKRFYESSVTTHASLRGLVGTLVDSASVFGIIFVLPFGGLAAAGVLGGATLVATGGYTVYQVCNAQNTIVSCKERGKKEMDELLGKIPVSEVLDKIEKSRRRKRLSN